MSRAMSDAPSVNAAEAHLRTIIGKHFGFKGEAPVSRLVFAAQSNLHLVIPARSQQNPKRHRGGSYCPDLFYPELLGSALPHSLV